MNTHIRWLEKQVEKAERQVAEAQRKLSTWVDALQLAEDEENPGEKEHEELSDGVRKASAEEIKPKLTILDVAGEVLAEQGPLTTRDLLEILKTKGKNTTLNSLTVLLNRRKPEKFDRDEDGKWYLVPQTGEEYEKQYENEEYGERGFDQDKGDHPF